MRSLCCLLFIGFAFPAAAQKNTPHISHLDREVRSFDMTAPAILLKEVTTPYQTDRQKVVSIFQWITTNISYNVRSWNRRKKEPVMFEEPDDTGKILKPLNLRVAETVLRRRMAVCDGYARLFKTFCDYAGIPSEVVMGYARVNGSRGRSKFKSNHTWNAVYIDSAWYLLDATWASGFTNYRGDEFTRAYDDKYFLTSPDQFILDHYPEDITWTLLKDPPAPGEFDSGPFRYTGFVKSRIDAYWPAKGIVEAAMGDSIRFEVESLSEQGLLFVSDRQPVDTIWSDDEPVIIGGRKKSFTYTVTDPAAEWLYVTCNGRIILRYRLNIKKPDNKVAVLSGN